MKRTHALLSLILLLTSTVQAQQATPDAVVDDLKKIYGDHPVRAVHAKGIMLEGSFTASPAAAAISTAAHLKGKPVPIKVRFSDSGGPGIPDSHQDAAPRGMAIRFELPNGYHTDLVTHSFNGFPAANADEFQALLDAVVASAHSPKGQPSPLDAYLGSHPAAVAYLTAPKPAPVSFATLPYYGVNAFKFTNGAGAATYGRYRLLPVAAPAYANSALADDYLRKEITQRLSRRPVQFKLMLQVAEAGDALDDPSKVWPDDRRLLELGTLTINKITPQSDEVQSHVVFSPNNLPDGIAVADPMLNFRGAAYAISYQRRN